MTTMPISKNFKRLLMYIAAYQRLHHDATTRTVVEDLTLAYAKQLLPGMPEKLWEETMKLMIKECEDEREKTYKKKIKTINQVKSRARSAERTAKRLRALL